MHSPTLITFGAMLMALVSGVLWAVWRVIWWLRWRAGMACCSYAF
jgi:hypothetical protein